jgi:hypothetical protein
MPNTVSALKPISIDACLAEIHGRVKAATPGPWLAQQQADGRSSIVPVLSITGLYTDQDADFISDARQDVPTLLSIIERVRKPLTASELRLFHDLYPDVTQALQQIFERRLAGVI